MRSSLPFLSVYLVLCCICHESNGLSRKSTSSTTNSIQRIRQSSKLIMSSSDTTITILPSKESVFNKKSLLFKSTVVVGSTLSAAVLIPKAVFLARYFIQMIEKVRRQNPVLLPVVGGAFISIFHFLRNDITKKGPEALFSDEFDATHHLTRVLAVIITVGCGCSLAFVGAAGEIGATVIRLSCTLLAVCGSRIFGNDSISGSIGLSSTISNNSSNNTSRTFNLPYIHSINLVGAAAGVAANFDAPLTGAMYSYEVAKRWNSRRVVTIACPGDSVWKKLICAVDLPSLLPALFGSAAAGEYED